MFSTVKVGQTIRNARIKRNMTQMQLADEMAVSYQAVSNWERGNSMPDISKLQQLCALLELRVDELLGEDDLRTQTVKKVLAKEETPSPEELADIAEIMSPEEVRETVEKVAEEHTITWEQLLSLAPFLEEASLDAFVRRAETGGNLSALVSLAPFLRQKTVDDLLRRVSVEEGDEMLLCGIAPFVGEDALSETVAALLASGAQVDTCVLNGLLPFVDAQTAKRIVCHVVGNG